MCGLHISGLARKNMCVYWFLPTVGAQMAITFLMTSVGQMKTKISLYFAHRQAEPEFKQASYCKQ